MRDNGFSPPSNPVLEPIESIQCKDAILDLTNPAVPREPEWPEAEFIVGNPPFLGGEKRSELGDDYTDALYVMYGSRIPNASDLCCYWFEKARACITHTHTHRIRAGLLATQGIRGRLNRTGLESIKCTGDIFFAVSDQEWVLNGAAVHVSMIGFDNGTETTRVLDGQVVETIATNLTTGVDVTQAMSLRHSNEFYHEGTKKGAKFELTYGELERLLLLPNPHGRPNSDVLRPYINGMELYGADKSRGIIYFGVEFDLEQAALYEALFKLIEERVLPRYGQSRLKWWQHERPRPGLIAAAARLSRYIATVRHSKHRIFVWLESSILPDSALGIFAVEDDYFMGLIQSRLHSAWSLSQGTQVRERESGFRYTPTTCFETFPFPQPTDHQRAAIAAPAKELDALRNNWLNPPELVRTEVLEFPGTVGGPWDRYIDRATVKEITPGGSAGAKTEIGTVKYPRVVAQNDECAAELKRRTLTNLYNQRPTWLDHAHRKLDAAVFSAYGWEPSISDDELLANLLALNLAAGR